jgi:hypothetical protein
MSGGRERAPLKRKAVELKKPNCLKREGSINENRLVR